jgi:hypothetical protein
MTHSKDCDISHCKIHHTKYQEECAFLCTCPDDWGKKGKDILQAHDEKCCSKCSGNFDGKGCTMSEKCPCHDEEEFRKIFTLKVTPKEENKELMAFLLQKEANYWWNETLIDPALDFIRTKKTGWEAKARSEEKQRAKEWAEEHAIPEAINAERERVREWVVDSLWWPNGWCPSCKPIAEDLLTFLQANTPQV